LRLPISLIYLLGSFLFSSTAPLWASETKSSFEKVLLLTATDDKQALIRACAVCLRANAKDADVLAIRARTYLEIDRLAEAQSDAERALALEPKSSSALTTRGYCRISKKDYKGALVDCEAAVKTQEPVLYVPLMQVDFGNLAALYKLAGQSKLAADAAHKAKIETLISKACECREIGAVDQAIGY
jgi:tetratricopeptide (TPR) repeat protein